MVFKEVSKLFNSILNKLRLSVGPGSVTVIADSLNFSVIDLCFVVFVLHGMLVHQLAGVCLCRQTPRGYFVTSHHGVEFYNAILI